MPELRWHELPVALWEARAGFQDVKLSHNSHVLHLVRLSHGADRTARPWMQLGKVDCQELLVLGGRLEDGELKHDAKLSVTAASKLFWPQVWALSVSGLERRQLLRGVSF